MKKHDELSDPTSCLAQAEDDEPIFVLRANDELAPAAIRYWARLYRAVKSRDTNAFADMTPAQVEKYREAEALAQMMLAWKAAKGE